MVEEINIVIVERKLADKELDSHEIICKICGQAKTRIRSGVFVKKIGKTPRWVDSNGKLFNGRVCPECHSRQTSARMSIKRMLND